MLGNWQIYRLWHKTEQISLYSKRLALPAIELPLPIPLDQLKFAQVSVQGEFMHEHEIHLYAGGRGYDSDGYLVLTPLRLADNSIILVNRGLVPSAQKLAQNRPQSIRPGLVKIQGIAMLSEQRSVFIPKNDEVKNVWFTVNLPQIKRYTKLPLADYYIMEGGEQPRSMLKVRDAQKINLKNDHLQYALTWYVLAIMVVVFYSKYMKR
jgi:surfeit locus 1 family protein